MKFVLGLLVCVFCLCANLSADEFGSFSLSPAQSPFNVPEVSSAFIPFSQPNRSEFQVASCHVAAAPSVAEIRVKKSGKYFISYSLSAVQFEGSTPDSLEWNTVLVVNGTSLNNTTTMGTTAFNLGSRTSVTGQTIVCLPKHSVVQVQITNTTPSLLEVFNATINLIEID